LLTHEAAALVVKIPQGGLAKPNPPFSDDKEAGYAFANRPHGLRRLRARANLLRRIKLISPVQPRLQKDFRSRLGQIRSISAAVPASLRGAFRDRHGRWAGDAVDAAALLTNSAGADGEVVWS